MKTQKKNIKYFLMGLFAILCGIALAVVAKGFSNHNKGDKSFAIAQALTKNCDCESIEQFMYFRGVKYSKKKGNTNEKAEYELTNCKYESLAKESYRINEMLTETVRYYEDIDYLKLEFIGPEKREAVIIKNGIIQ